MRGSSGGWGRRVVGGGWGASGWWRQETLPLDSLTPSTTTGAGAHDLSDRSTYLLNYPSSLNKTSTSLVRRQ